ncbi:hypothetical protein EDB85DRAFT_1615175 [Lactarius pseudohatsudake]|nr:hypothetical protein EDB85DRAFT_1615175 [Lactarius pseudohatsudake]
MLFDIILGKISGSIFSRGVKLSRGFLMPCQLTLADWHHPHARRALSQDAIGRALCVMVRTFAIEFIRAWLNFLAGWAGCRCHPVRAGCPRHRVRAIPAALDVRRSRRIGVSFYIHSRQTVLCSCVVGRFTELWASSSWDLRCSCHLSQSLGGIL